MQPRRWTNPGQPQTLQISVFLLYINAALAFISMAQAQFFPLFSLLAALASIAGGFGIANERKWGYVVGLVAALYFGLVSLAVGNLINILFDVALVALLLHPQSRDYQRIWFK